MKKIALCLLSIMLLTSCGNESSKMSEGNNEFAVVTLQGATADLQTSYPATIKGMQDIEIRPKVAGYLTKLLVDEGATVRKGQPLFLIDSEQYQAAVKNAEAQIRVIKANIASQALTVQNKRMLFEQKIISNYDMQMAENTLESLKAQRLRRSGTDECTRQPALVHRDEPLQRRGRQHPLPRGKSRERFQRRTPHHGFQH